MLKLKKLILYPLIGFMLTFTLLIIIKNIIKEESIINLTINESIINNIPDDIIIKAKDSEVINTLIENTFLTLNSNVTIYEKQGFKFNYINAENYIFNTNSFDLKNYYKHIKEIENLQKLALNISDTYKVDLSTIEKIVDTVNKETDNHNIDMNLMLALIEAESGFNQYAESHVGALGLTQVIPKYHQDKIKLLGLKNEDIWGIKENIKIGTMVLKTYIDLSGGNIKVALQRYNGSLGDETKKYSNKILAKYNKYEKLINM